MEGGFYQRVGGSNSAPSITTTVSGGDDIPLPRSFALQLGNAAFFLLFILFNILAAGGVFSTTPRSLRHLEPTLITPSDYAFGTWIAIFLLATLFALYQAVPRRRTSLLVFQEIQGLFMLSCLLQIAYLVSLCSLAPPIVPFLFLVALLLALLVAYLRLNRLNKGVATPFWEYFCVHLLFSVFLAWVTMETGFTLSWMLKYQFHWAGSPWDESGWAVILLGILSLVAMVTLFLHRDGVFGLVVAWGCFGVAAGHRHVAEMNIAGNVFGGILLVTSLIMLVVKYRRWEEERSGLKVRIVPNNV